MENNEFDMPWLNKSKNKDGSQEHGFDQIKENGLDEIDSLKANIPVLNDSVPEASVPYPISSSSAPSPLVRSPLNTPVHAETRSYSRVVSQPSIATLPPPHGIDKITVLYADNDQQVYNNHVVRIKELCPWIEIVAYAYNGKMAVDFAGAYSPDVLVVSHDTIIKDGLTVAKEVMSKYPNIGVVLVTTSDINYQVYVQREGITNILVRPSRTQLFSLEDMAKAIVRAKMSKVVSTQETVTVEQSQLMRNRPMVLQESVEKSDKSNVIAVYSAKGGSGKTTFAVNLACALQKYGGIGGKRARVCLWELDMGFGSMDLFFNVSSPKNITHLTDTYSPENHRFMDETLIDSIMHTDEETGLKVLMGLRLPLDIESVKDEHIEAIMNLLKDRFDTIIIDTSSDIAKTQLLKALDIADKIYVLMPMDVVSIRNTKELIPLFKSSYFEYDENKIRVILNMVSDDGEFDVPQVYRVLKEVGVAPWGTIPYDRQAVLSSINKGIPLVLSDIDNKVSHAIYEIALSINPEMPADVLDMNKKGRTDKKEKKGLFGGLFKSKNNPPKSVASPTPKKSLFGRSKPTPPLVPAQQLQQETYQQENSRSQTQIQSRPPQSLGVSRLPKKRI